VISLTFEAVLCVDNDFEPHHQDSSDDEETIEKDEREHKNVRSFSLPLLDCFMCDRKLSSHQRIVVLLVSGHDFAWEWLIYMQKDRIIARCFSELRRSVNDIETDSSDRKWSISLMKPAHPCL